MEDYISKGDAYIELMKCKDFDTDKLYHGNHYLKIACDIVRSIPSADVVERPLYERALSDVVRLSVERKKGKWVKARGSWCTPGGDPVWECSLCGKGVHVYGIEHGTYGSDIADGQWIACPNCGADMRDET